MRQRILDYCEQTFLRYGIRSVSMDAIAVGLGISKKTIYQYFTDKEEIIKALMDKRHECDQKKLQEINTLAKDPIEKFFLAFKYFNNELASINPALLYDLKKYHPDVWQTFCTRKENDPAHMIEDVLMKGMEQGLIRKDVNMKVMSRYMIRMIDMMADGISFPASQFKLTEIHSQIMMHFIYGVATIEGHQKIEIHKSILDQDTV